MGFMRGRVLSGITVILDAPVERPLSGGEFGGANFRFGSIPVCDFCAADVRFPS